MGEIEACRRCELGHLREHVVIYRGPAHPTVVFIGEAPGREEDRQGVPFVGRAGKRLDEAIARLGDPGRSAGILNLVKCRPPENRLGAAPIRACAPFLDRQLKLLRPRILVPLGAHALRAIDPAAPRVMAAAGTPRRTGDHCLFPLLHPAATFRSRRAAERWAADIDRLRDWLQGELETL
ncbi:MAG TPA: uracil-DNA glycosylase [Thermoplasmata archaeon]|nr:uracil-DNA glycosylase [Thermoplasmata archaeon]